MSKFTNTLKGFGALSIVLGAQALGCLFQCVLLAAALLIGLQVLGYGLQCAGLIK